MTAFREDIVNGPSKFALMLALFDWEPHRKVTITGQAGQKFELWITGISAEDGSGESWNIGGTTTVFREGKEESRNFSAYFRTDSRKGWISVREYGYGLR